MKQRKPGAGRPTTAKDPWGSLAEKVGGSEKLAEKLGTTRATVNRWSRDVHRVPELAKREVIRLCKYYGITEGVDQL